MQKLNCSNFNLGDKMCFIPNSYNHYNTSFSKFWLVLQILWTTLLFQDHNSRYSKDLIANMSFLEVIDENEPQVELEKLSKVAPTIGIGKAIEVINYAMKKWTMHYIVVKYSGKPTNVNFFITVINSTLLLKLNFLFQILIGRVNNFDLRQYFVLAEYACM